MRGLDSASSKKQTNMHGAWKRVYVDPSEVQRNASESDVALCEKDNPTATVGHIVPRCDRKKEAKSKKIKISTESKMKNDAVRSDDTIKGAKRKTESKAKGATKQAKKAKGKDPNAPKRPASGFLIFMLQKRVVKSGSRCLRRRKHHTIKMLELERLPMSRP
ncbi:hypothetical protein M758_6G120000 [Ceratodon purpureus]|uniref:Uncharacterized protein n=1 Tax=Ceratodon purpureus TaxID=3225 RepID=A0A8T0HGU8_CERPU|nr:hypothetical protein KC19_6G124700 [Ceratodon purpureus]KAG0569915.1 hypothetical protein KC19_6G124700 [Ceratodon purpureus]KAG0613662.1 hypothetical protein M758_6G120000 [Ceratodon purpureus]KAG0613663.1 hypothetical protein M758_6G120000 [Ceratodon purpureus]